MSATEYNERRKAETKKAKHGRFRDRDHTKILAFIVPILQFLRRHHSRALRVLTTIIRNRLSSSRAKNAQRRLQSGVSSRNRYICQVMRSRRISILVLGAVTLSTVAEGIVTDNSSNPYANISVRNVFGLKPPPLPPAPPDITPPAPNITLTGIYKFGRKRVMMMAPVPAKPPIPAREESYILGEGERDGDIEVLSIDEKAGVVQVNNHGTMQTLDFANNGAKLPAPAALPVAMPGLVPGQPMNASVPQVVPSVSPGAGTVIRFGNAAQLASSGGGSPSGFAAGPAQPQNTITAEEQTILIEAQRAKMMDSGDERYKILPITEFTSQVTGTATGGAPPPNGPPRPF